MKRDFYSTFYPGLPPARAQFLEENKQKKLIDCLTVWRSLTVEYALTLAEQWSEYAAGSDPHLQRAAKSLPIMQRAFYAIEAGLYRGGDL